MNDIRPQKVIECVLVAIFGWEIRRKLKTGPNSGCICVANLSVIDDCSDTLIAATERVYWLNELIIGKKPYSRLPPLKHLHSVINNIFQDVHHVVNDFAIHNMDRERFIRKK